MTQTTKQNFKNTLFHFLATKQFILLGKIEIKSFVFFFLSVRNSEYVKKWIEIRRITFCTCFLLFTFCSFLQFSSLAFLATFVTAVSIIIFSSHHALFLLFLRAFSQSDSCSFFFHKYSTVKTGNENKCTEKLNFLCSQLKKV